jgi:integrase
MTKRLTAAAAARLRPASKRLMIPDGRGLYLAIQPSGAKSWQMLFRGPTGKMAKLTLGPFDPDGNTSAKPIVGAPLTLAGARQLAADVNRRRAAGEDVTTRKVRGTDLFPAAARDFIREHAKPKVRGWRAQARLLGLDPDTLVEIDGGLASRWRGRAVTELTASDVFTVVDEVKRRGILGTAPRRDGPRESRSPPFLVALSRMFRFLLEHRRVEANPCISIVRPQPPRARERVLSDAEIAAFWRATAELRPPFGQVLKLLLLTGQRLNEIAALQWEEIASDGTALNLPGSRTKNHRDHTVPLSSPARSILAGVKRVPDSAFVFTTTGTTPISGWSKCKRRLDSLMGVEDWRLHDLRRTVITNLARAGADLPVIERAVNHISGSFAGVVQVYQKYKFADEVRTALEKWAVLLLAIVGERAR